LKSTLDEFHVKSKHWESIFAQEVFGLQLDESESPSDTLQSKSDESQSGESESSQSESSELESGDPQSDTLQLGKLELDKSESDNLQSQLVKTSGKEKIKREIPTVFNKIFHFFHWVIRTLDVRKHYFFIKNILFS